MERKKEWIFIENSADSVRYKVGDSDSAGDSETSMDSQDYEVLPTEEISLPSTFEFVPPKVVEHGSGDELEIHENHFNSCPTSDMEDSDIEVVMKSPSNSETTSLCSLNSPRGSIPNTSCISNSPCGSIPNASCNIDEIIFKMEHPGEIHVNGDNEDDSEVEVISRSIHRNCSTEMTFLDEVNNELIDSSSSSGSDNENEVVFNDLAGSRKTSSAFRKTSSASRKTSSTSMDGKRIEQSHLESSYQTQGTDTIESVENVGIKYILEDLHVIRQTNGKFSGLRTSTLALTVCLSLSLGIYLGNHMSPIGKDSDSLDDAFLVPDEELQSTNEDQLKVNITFKYSSSTKETLKSVLSSFRKLKNDYDRLYATYLDTKERCSLKKQMKFYWRKQVEENSIEQGKKNKNRNEDKFLNQSLLPDTGTSSHLGNANVLFKLYILTLSTHKITIQKLSRDLKKERLAVSYWRKRYDVEILKENTCSKYDADRAPFSFSDCLNMFTNVMPSLDISVLNVTNRAEHLADHIHKAWSRLRGWNIRMARKDDPMYLRKVNRFRKIFTMSNVVNSDNVIKLTRNENVTSDVNSLPDIYTRPNHVAVLNDSYVTSTVPAVSGGGVDDSLRSEPHDVCSIRTRYNTSQNRIFHKKPKECVNGIVWFKNNLQKSRFLQDIMKWKNIFKKEIELAKSFHIAQLLNDNMKKSKRILAFHGIKRGVIALKAKVKTNEASAMSKWRSSLLLERKSCNSSLNSMKLKYEHSVKVIHQVLRKKEQLIHKKKLRHLMDNGRERYTFMLDKNRSSIRKEEKDRYRRKLQNIMKSYKGNLRKSYRKHHKKRGNHFGGRVSSKNHKWRDTDKSSEPRHGGHTRERKYRKKKKGFRSEKHKRTRFEKDRRRKLVEKISEYANKFKQCDKKLDGMYKDLEEQMKHQKQILQNYKENLEKYQQIIMDYQRKINEANAREEHLKKKVVNLSEKVKNYDKLLEKNARLKASLSASDTDESNGKKVLYVDIQRGEDADKSIAESMNESDIQKSYIMKMSANDCPTDDERKPFYNIEDVYPKDLFSKTTQRNPFLKENSKKSDSDSSTLSLSEHPDVHGTYRGGDNIFSSASFSGELSFSETNKSHVEHHDVTDYLDASEEYSHDEHLTPNNWYINWMLEKKRSNKDASSVKKEGYWFWKAMKEREKLRSQEGEVNWFWKAMKEREQIRSREGDLNWFWMAMKRREKRRTHNVHNNWFWRAMKERENLRNTGKGKEWNRRRKSEL